MEMFTGFITLGVIGLDDRLTPLGTVLIILAKSVEQVFAKPEAPDEDNLKGPVRITFQVKQIGECYLRLHRGVVIGRVETEIGPLGDVRGSDHSTCNSNEHFSTLGGTV